MKKNVCLLFLLLLLATSLFADKNRFYENGKIINTVYVNSEDGLKVRDYPSLNSNRICGLSHKMRIQVVAIGKEETIDDITDPWVEILIPNIYWKNRNVPEYGWVFGGYLSKEKSDKGIVLKTLKEKKEYLLQQNYYWSNNSFFIKFHSNGRYECFVDGTPKYGEGNWVLDINDNLRLEPDYNTQSEKYHITKYDYGFFEAVEYIQNTTMEVTFGLRVDWDVFSNEELIYTKEMYYLYDRIHLFVADPNCFRSRFALLYKSGISPMENSQNSYVKDQLDAYEEYWEPIKKEHQEKADKL